VDCGTTIIGDYLHCPACHARHVTTARSLRDLSLGQILLGWFVVAQILVVLIFLMILAGRGC